MENITMRIQPRDMVYQTPFGITSFKRFLRISDSLNLGQGKVDFNLINFVKNKT